MTDQLENPEERPRYFMVRVWRGGVPKKKHVELAAAMTEAARLAEKEKVPVTVLQSLSNVQIDTTGKPFWTDARPAL